MEKNLNEGTSFHQSDKPILCANGCGFFGTAATMNLCSKCYRDHRLKEEQAAAIAKSVMTSSSARVTSAPVVVVVDEVEKTVKGTTEPVQEEQSASIVKSVMTLSSVRMTSAPAVEKEVAKVKNRCGSCNKKFGVMGFKCRCGNTFCGSHRYPEEHGCEFDFKSAGRDAIKRANPIVKADKIQRF